MIVTRLRRPSESIGGELWFPDAHQLQHSPWFLYPDEAWGSGLAWWETSFRVY